MNTQSCLYCNRPILLTKDNTVLHVVVFQAWFSLAEILCSGCNQTMRCLFGPQDYIEYNGLFTAMGCEVVYTDFAAEDVVEWFEDNFDLHLPRLHELTPRQETHIAFLAYELENEDPFKELEAI